jgi:hypothetical protein
MDPRVMSPGTVAPRKKTGRSIRLPARIRHFTKPDPVSSPMEKADGRQPSMPKSISRPLPSEDLSLSFRPCDAAAAASVGRMTTPFIHKIIMP